MDYLDRAARWGLRSYLHRRSDERAVSSCRTVSEFDYPELAVGGRSLEDVGRIRRILLDVGDSANYLLPD